MLIPVLAFAWGAVFLACNVGIQGAILPLSLAGAVVLGRSFTNQALPHMKWTAIQFMLLGLILTLSYGLNSYFYDVSFDGQWYHQDAIIFLKEGLWNPFLDPLLQNKMVSGENADWLNHYPKASWIAASAVYAYFDKIELGKSLNLLLLLASFCISFSYFLRKTRLSVLISLLLAGLLACSPSAFGQVFCYYVDGQISSMMLILTMLLLEQLENPGRTKGLIPIGLAFIYLVNLKFTALIYGCILLAAAFIWAIRFSPNKTKLKDLLIPYFTIFAAGFFIFGYPTYVRNTTEKGHPLYPIMGNGDAGEKLAQISYPVDFFSLNRFQKFYRSTFAVPQYVSGEDHPSIPKELFRFQHLDYYRVYYQNHQPVMMSPLGPVYGEFVVLFLPLLGYLVFLNRKNKAFIYISGVCLLSMIIFPDFWIYRYTPQLYFFYFIFLGFALVSTNKPAKFAGLVLSLVMLINVGINDYCNLQYNWWRSNEVRHEMQALAGKKIAVQRGWMLSFKYRLKEHGLPFEPLHTEDTRLTYIPFKSENGTGWKYALVGQ